MNYDLIVIGGGAAGLWAAGTAAESGLKTLVIEKNRKAGVKILMSGGTRCNITHHCGIDGILDAYGSQGRFLKPSLYNLSPQQVVAQFNRLGVATKVEATGKVFPQSDRAIDVRDALVKRMELHSAKMITGLGVQQLAFDPENDCWNITTSDGKFYSRFALLCSGGLSYPGCGTTGDGYAWAKTAGHHLTETHPALTPLTSPTNWVHELSGITLPHVSGTVTLKNGQRIKDQRNQITSSLLLTHFGCSGPLAMNLSRFVTNLEKPNDAVLEVDLIPNLSHENLTGQFLRDQGRTIGNLLHSLGIPKALSQCLFKQSACSADTRKSDLTKKARLSLLRNIKSLQIPLDGSRGYAKAEVTAGGISTKEVNPKTMESRKTPKLYLAGEILDIDGPIGGYNFQAAFATGHTAALAVAKTAQLQ